MTIKLSNKDMACIENALSLAIDYEVSFLDCIQGSYVKPGHTINNIKRFKKMLEKIKEARLTATQ
jgi:hypothetical protein